MRGSSFRRLRRVLTSLRAQLVHTHRYKENLFSCLVATGLGIRPVVTYARVRTELPFSHRQE